MLGGEQRERKTMLPFTRAELICAQMLARRQEEAERIADELLQECGLLSTMAVDGHLLLLAALSDEIAERVIAFRPTLAEIVGMLRRDPEGFIRSITRKKLRVGTQVT